LHDEFDRAGRDLPLLHRVTVLMLLMLETDAALVVAIALAGGILVQCLAQVIRVPAIILLLAAGVGLGPDGLDWVRPEALGEGLFLLVDFAVAVILFEGALNLDITRLRREERVIRRLITGGALITLLGGTLAARLWLTWDWPVAALFGALVVVTGPTVVGPLVRNLRLQPRLQTVLEAEGVFIDPIGAFLAVLVMQVTLAADASEAAAGMWDLTSRLLTGGALGAVGGLAMVGLLRLRVFVHGLENVLVLALVFLLFHLGEHLLSQTGLLTVTVAGVIVGNFETPVKENLREFKDQLTLLLIGGVFVLLAADVRLTEVMALGWRGVAVLITLIIVVRPVMIWLATRGASLTWRERGFLSVIAPRGIIAAAVASLMAATLDANGIPGGDGIRALVFVVIAGTVVTAGVLAWPVSAILGLRLPARDRVAILGAQGLGLALGTALRKAGTIVVFIDNDPRRCQAAERDGFSVVYGNALQDRTLRRARVELVGTVVGATFNENLNSQFVHYARQSFRVPNGLVGVSTLDHADVPEHVTRHQSGVLFDGAHDPARWDVRWRQDQVVIRTFVFEPPHEQHPNKADAAPSVTRQDGFVILTTERKKTVTPRRLRNRPRSGDRAAVALHLRSAEQAIEQLAIQGWHPAPAGDPPPVETRPIRP
jgi:NhaP-type Na+/H+ or K+/H+ antiporter